MEKDARSSFEWFDFSASVEQPYGKSLAGIGDIFIAGTQKGQGMIGSLQSAALKGEGEARESDWRGMEGG